MKNKVSVSIISPVYNRAEIIIDTINSIQNQTYTFWEFIIVDDGSTDCTIDVIKEFSQSDERILLIERDRLPKGAPTCRNIGYENASGDYIIFLDSDDILFPDALKNRAIYKLLLRPTRKTTPAV